MRKTDGVKEREARTGQKQILFFKSQDEFVKALRKGTDAVEGIGFTEKVPSNK